MKDSSRNCCNCGTKNGMAPFSDRSVKISFKELSTEIAGLAGWTCGACDETEFTPDSAARYADASDSLIEAYRREVGEQVKRIRKKASLTQGEAVRYLSGGGHNAFSRYERAEVEPPKPLLILMALIDRHPELLQEVIHLNDTAALGMLSGKDHTHSAG